MSHEAVPVLLVGGHGLLGPAAGPDNPAPRARKFPDVGSAGIARRNLRASRRRRVATCLTGGQELTIPAEGHHVNDLEAAAGKAELTGQIRSFMTWLGEGRKLTQTGRIGLADARHLVELLGTGDKIDPEIGGRVLKTRSSEELPYLTRIVEWMKAARLVRVTGTRLVPVKKNAALASRPLDLVLAMLAAYPRLGKSLFPRNTWRQSLVGDEFALIGPELLTALLVSQGPCPMDGLKQVAFEQIAVRYMLDRLSQQQLDMLRRTIGVDVTIAVAALGILGVVVVDQAARRRNSPISAASRSGACAAWRSRATRYCRCGSRSATSATRRCGGRCSSRRPTRSAGSTG